MPKSRSRKQPKKPQTPMGTSGVVRMTTEMHDALLRQREAFRAKFGRDPGPNDPVFFDPSKDQPTPIEPVDMEADVLAAMSKANLPPEFAYAYKKTGGLLLVEGMRDRWPPDRVKEWEDAVNEYRAIEAASKQPDRPSKEEWNTSIPELLVSPFTRQDLAKVHACLQAVEPIEAQGMTLITRIELAAAFLAAACSHGYTSGDETGVGASGPDVFALAEQLVVRRAREIYAQDSA
jgi:hypothetical protein